eukprot:TRINITY_DN2739_c0_g1_i1.p1 TRINITY_DN2739_c0_g1~~TRINITY_DN2739_c0_g1_i1.p1  ORF type:complete len:334 (-),score=75.61 TRINITY_DN2739_c0_g1_i1:47-1048(-)
MTTILNSPFDRTSTAEQVIENIDLTNKLAIITGASSGIGVETARVLAAQNAHVILAVRNVEKTVPVQQEIIASTGNQNVEIMEVDLSSFESIRQFTDAFLAKELPIDLLINNAGIMACPNWKTTDGLDMQFGVNHVGHFLLTCRLIPALRLADGPVRVVNLSSSAHKLGVVELDDYNFEGSEYSKWNAYGRSKTANIWFSIELNRRLQNLGIGSSFAVHPGVIKTGLDQHMSDQDFKDLGMFDEDGNLTESMKNRMKSVEQGAATSVFAATSPLLNLIGGLYLEDCNAYGPENGLGKPGHTDYAYNKVGARKLWSLSETLTGESFNFGNGADV